MEIWDAYKKDGSLAGCDLFRDRLIPSGLFHIVSEVLVKHIDGTYLLMQRDWKKEGYPGLFEAGASGSILKGEIPYQGAIRELQEETGITTDDLTLVYSQSDLVKTFYFGFICITDCPKDSIILQQGETIAYKWLIKKDFIEFMNSSEFIPSQRDRWKPFLSII